MDSCMIPGFGTPFVNIITVSHKHKIDVHKHSGIMVTTFSIMMVILPYPLTTLVGIGVGQQTGQGIQLAWKSCHQSTSE